MRIPPDGNTVRVQYLRSLGEVAEVVVHLVQPPEDVVKAAADGGLEPTYQARGHDELEVRVRLTYDRFVAPGQFTFRRQGPATRLRDVVKFGWEMVPAGGGEVAGAGTEVLVLDAAGRIRVDYQFIEG